MKTINKFRIIILALLSFNIYTWATPIKNKKTETVKVYGNCEMCKSRIESAIYRKGISEGGWNTDTKILSLSYNSEKITVDEILKQLAYAGYDNEKFLAPDDAYTNLPGCCQYTRKDGATGIKMSETTKTKVLVTDSMKKILAVNTNPLSKVFTAYFAVKDALTKDDGTMASAKAKDLFNVIDKVDMGKMNPSQHTIWMKYQEKLSYDAEHIKGVTETEHQREHFTSLSKNMFEVMKSFKMDLPVYYDYCPMANNGKGANWLSLQKDISNPYMGRQMPTCGKIQETLNN